MANAAFWIWFGITVLTVLVWASRHIQLAHATRVLRPLTSGMFQGENGALPRVSMLVAAKDEAANIGHCVRSLLSQDYPDFELIAINDRSGDGTGEILNGLAASDRRMKALHIEELRAGWAGKNNAMRSGTEQATGEWLCFTDADCVHKSPRTLQIAMRYAQKLGVDFLSVLPAHASQRLWEYVIQPACSGIMMIWFNPMHVNNPRRRAAYANGAFMLMSRKCYETIGRHDAVKLELNEDVQMARLAKERGQRLAVVANEDLYTVRMYDTIRAAWNGWSRIFYGCFRSVRRLVLSLVVVLMVSLSPWITLAASLLMWMLGENAAREWLWLAAVAGAACLAQWTIMLRFYVLNHAPAWYGLFYPLGAMFGFGALVKAIRRASGRGSITWRGTTYGGQVLGVVSKGAS